MFGRLRFKINKMISSKLDVLMSSVLEKINNDDYEIVISIKLKKEDKNEASKSCACGE